MAITLKCHNCGATKTVDVAPKEFVCVDCGAVNVVVTGDGMADEACSCIAPTSFEWTLPSGYMEGPAGKIFVTAQGSHMTKAEYVAAFGLDPEIALAWMRARRGKK